MTYTEDARNKQTPKTGKVENDSNKQGATQLAQLNQGKRTPDSRTDREAHLGRGNQSRPRCGPGDHQRNPLFLVAAALAAPEIHHLLLLWPGQI